MHPFVAFDVIVALAVLAGNAAPWNDSFAPTAYVFQGEVFDLGF